MKHECDFGYFDRTLCGCGAMHTYCNICGERDDDCPLEISKAIDNYLNRVESMSPDKVLQRRIDNLRE